MDLRAQETREPGLETSLMLIEQLEKRSSAHRRLIASNAKSVRRPTSHSPSRLYPVAQSS